MPDPQATKGADVVTGTLGLDLLNTLGGVDQVITSTGADTVDGGSDDDTIVAIDDDSRLGGDGNDSLSAQSDGNPYGGAGNDTLDATTEVEGGIGASVLHGGDGDDRVNGGFEDSVLGDARDDSVTGGYLSQVFASSGNDTLAGWVVDAGAGDDPVAMGSQQTGTLGDGADALHIRADGSMTSDNVNGGRVTLTDCTPSDAAIDITSGRSDNPDDPDPALYLTFSVVGTDVRVRLYGGTIPVLQGMALSDIHPDDFTLDGAAVVTGVNTNLDAQSAAA